MCSACRKCSALDAIQSVFNAAIPQMEVFITYLHPDIICRGCMVGCKGNHRRVEVTHYMQQVRGGGGTGETWRPLPCSTLH